MAENAVNIQENKMGFMPVDRLLITMALPMVISMLVQALYNVVDSIFVAQINENALTAVSLAFPIQNLMIAVAAGTGIGVNAQLSRSLGEKDSEKVNKIADNGIFLALLSYLAFAVAGAFFSRLFFEMQTDNAEIVNYGAAYLSICTLASFGVFEEIMFERLLQSTGKTFYAMISQGTGAIVNIIFNPILILGLFGFPKLGNRRIRLSHRFGADHRHVPCRLFQQNEKPRGETWPETFPARRANHQTDLFHRGSLHHYGIDLVCHGIRIKRDSDGVYAHGCSGFRGLFQAPELCFHAGVRLKPGYDPRYCL